MPGGSAGATLTAVLETKEARIATLERQVALLESELAALVSPPPPSLAPSHTSLFDKAEPPFKRQVSFLLNDVRVMKDGRTSAPPASALQRAASHVAGLPLPLQHSPYASHALHSLHAPHLPAPRYYSATTL